MHRSRSAGLSRWLRGGAGSRRLATGGLSSDDDGFGCGFWFGGGFVLGDDVGETHHGGWAGEMERKREREV